MDVIVVGGEGGEGIEASGVLRGSGSYLLPFLVGRIEFKVVDVDVKYVRSPKTLLGISELSIQGKSNVYVVDGNLQAIQNTVRKSVLVLSSLLLSFSFFDSVFW